MKFHYSNSNICLTLFCILVILCSIKAQPQSNSNNGSHFLADDYLTANFANEDSLINDEPENSGAWIQFGIGTAKPSLNYNFNPSNFTQFAFSGHLRKNKTIFSLGIDHAATTCCWETDTYWGSYGYILHSNFIDGSISAGLSISTWQYDTETETGIINSPVSIGIIIKAQILPHLPKGFGLGLVLTLNASKEVSYISISIVLAIGDWSW